MALRRVLPLLLFLFTAHALAVEPVLRVSSGPSTVRIEQLPDRQDLNFEIFIDNRGATALNLRVLQVSAFDAAGRLLLRRQLDDNGIRPSIQTLPERSIAAGQSLTVFNPFSSFGKELDLARLHYQFTLVDADGETEQVAALDVRPLRAPGKTSLRLPVRGRAINYDGHDYYAHHRRFDYSFAPIAQLGFKSNFMRYGYDFVPVDAHGAMHRGSGERNEDYFGFGAELPAAGDGVVVALVDDRPDNRKFDQSRLADDPMVLFGNYLVIDHGNGEFSVYGHLQQHSVRVKAGQQVRQGEVVARIGASGSAFFPHLHYQLQDGPDTRAEGLPSYFMDFQVSNGSSSLTRSLATVDTGEIVESR